MSTSPTSPTLLNSVTGVGGPAPLPPSSRAPVRSRWRESPWGMALRSGRVAVGGGILLTVVLVCLVTLPWTLGGEPFHAGRLMGPVCARDAAGCAPPFQSVIEQLIETCFNSVVGRVETGTRERIRSTISS